MFRALNISASGLTAERLRMDIVSNNIANVNTTKTASGGAYRRQMPVFQAIFEQHVDALEKAQIGEKFHGSGVRVTDIVEDKAPMKTVYDPEHPHADKEGYVHMPNVNIVKEMVDMITASRAYEANVTSMNTAKQIFSTALQIGQG